MLLMQDVGKTKVKIEISPMCGDTIPLLSRLAPNGLRSIKLKAFSKTVQYL